MTVTLSDGKPRWQVPRLDPGQRWVGGAAAALATEIGVQPLVIRGAFAFLGVNGVGLLLYPLLWGALVLAQPQSLLADAYEPTPKAPSPFHRYVALVLTTLGAAMLGSSLGLTISSALLWPTALTMTGALLAWSRDREEGGAEAVIRVVLSTGLVITGGIAGYLLLPTVTFTETVALIFVALVVFGGVALVVLPTVARIGRDFDNERQERVRSDERARMAAHLHDSVLQTLTLIQRNADNPIRTSQLARQQERELRQWLYGKPGPRPGTTRLEEALRQAADRVEERHEVRVEIVAVGDTEDLDPNVLEPLVAAAQEAMTNAANHAQVPTIDVYAERRTDAIDVFVRDNGIGFDVDHIDPDRRGLRSSILERMAREGGSATVHSEPGGGTEVELNLPYRAPTAETDETADRSDRAENGDSR